MCVSPNVQQERGRYVDSIKAPVQLVNTMLTKHLGNPASINLDQCCNTPSSGAKPKYIYTKNQSRLIVRSLLILHLKLRTLPIHVQNILRTDHGPNAQRGQPESALMNLRRDLIQQVAFPGDVVVDVHDTDYRVEDPDDQENNPVGGAGGFVAEAVGHGPSYHAD